MKFILNMDLKNTKDMELHLILQQLRNMDYAQFTEEVLPKILYKKRENTNEYFRNYSEKERQENIR